MLKYIINYTDKSSPKELIELSNILNKQFPNEFIFLPEECTLKKFSLEYIKNIKNIVNKIIKEKEKYEME